MANMEETLQQLLNKIATEYQYENPEIIMKQIFSGGANYTSKLYTVIIREENKEDLHLFAKVAAVGENFRSELPLDPYIIERFAYTKLAKIYASLEKKNQVPEEHRLYFTKYYGSNSTLNQEILVLDNLVAQGYGPHDRFHSMNWEYASSAITDLAKMHALSFAFSKQYPEEFEKTLVTAKIDWSRSKGMNDMFQRTITSALKTVKPEYKAALQKFLEKQKYPFTMYTPIRSTVIVHGDFRGNNLLHRVREDGKVDIKIMDLQTLQAGSPAADLIYFIFTGTDEQFRAQYYDKLIEHYYTQLSAAMKRLNLDPEETFSRADFDYEMKEKLPYGLSLSVLMLPVITIDSKNAPEVNESLEISDFSVDKTSDLYAERLHGVVNDYVKWGILK